MASKDPYRKLGSGRLWAALCCLLLLLDLLLTSPRPHSNLSAPPSPHSASSRTMDLSTTSSTYKAQHSLDQLTQSIRDANNLKAILQLSPQSETIIRTGPSLNWVRLPATSTKKERYNSSFRQHHRVANDRVSHLAIVPALTNITSEQVFLFSYPLTTCSIYWSALRGLEKLHMDSTFVFRDRGLSNLYHNRRISSSPSSPTPTPFPNTMHGPTSIGLPQKRKVPHRQCTAAHRRTLPPSAKTPTVPVFIPLLW